MTLWDLRLQAWTMTLLRAQKGAVPDKSYYCIHRHLREDTYAYFMRVFIKRCICIYSYLRLDIKPSVSASGLQ